MSNRQTTTRRWRRNSTGRLVSNNASNDSSGMPRLTQNQIRSFLWRRDGSGFAYPPSSVNADPAYVGSLEPAEPQTGRSGNRPSITSLRHRTRRRAYRNPNNRLTPNMLRNMLERAFVEVENENENENENPVVPQSFLQRIISAVTGQIRSLVPERIRGAVERVIASPAFAEGVQNAIETAPTGIPIRDGGELRMRKSNLGENAIAQFPFEDGENIEVLYTEDNVKNLNAGNNVPILPAMVFKSSSVDELLKSGSTTNPLTRQPIALRERRILRFTNTNSSGGKRKTLKQTRK